MIQEELYMDYKNPLIFTLSDKPSFRSTDNLNAFNIDVTKPWKNFKAEVHRAAEITDSFDYIAVSYDKELLDSGKVSRKSLDIMSGELGRVGTNYNVPTINRFNDNIYLLNPKHGEGSAYMPSNDTVINKYYSFENNDAWQKHQSDVWSKFSEINTLRDGSFGPDHKGILMDPSRGLKEEDLSEFFSITSNKTIIPSLVDDDLVGMPGVNARKTSDNFYFGDRLVGSGAIALSSIGSGYVIPMKNKNGDMAKFQVGADISAYNLTLKARAADGVSIQTSEYSEKNDKKKVIYTFKLEDGSPSELKVTFADNNKATFEDAKGTFDVGIKQDIKQVLIDRGYQIPEIIDSLKVLPGAKYNWPAPGNMIGSKEKNGLDVPRLVSPSEAGFIPVREPATPEAGYTLLVVEGALKGQIVAKHLEKPEMKDVTDSIATNGKGLIVSQVPGVIRKFIESTQSIYDTYDIKDSVVAMDADGRYNRSVAKGIKDSEEVLSAHGPVRVMSWNPEQKGLDDALIAISRKEITLDDFGMTFGTAAELFPLEQATPPNPYKLDGTRANKLDWQDEFEKSKERSAIAKSKILEESRSLDAKLAETTNVVSSETFNDHIGSAPVQKTVVNKLELPPIYQVNPADFDRIAEKQEQGEISEIDMQDFLQSVSDLTKDLHDRVSQFAK